MPGYITRRLWNFKRQISEGDERIRWKGTTCSAQLVICILQVPALLEKTCRCWLTRNSMFLAAPLFGNHPHRHKCRNAGPLDCDLSLSLSLAVPHGFSSPAGRRSSTTPKDDNLYLIFEGLPGCQLMDWSERSCTYSARPSVNLRLGATVTVRRTEVPRPGAPCLGRRIGRLLQSLPWN